VSPRLAVPLILLGLACAAGRTGRELEPAELARAGDPGTLVATYDIPGSFLIRQQLRFRFGDEEGSFEAVVQKLCDEVRVVGLTPFGSPAFAIHQRGLDVRVESYLPGPWPFDPRQILLDVHRIYFVPIAEAAPPDAIYAIRHGDETLFDRWSAGRLVERTFRRVDGDPPGRIVVTYPGGVTRGSAPREVRLENERYDYEITVTTLSRTELVCAPATEDPLPASR
jgi:hypothetical protein